MTRTWTIDTLVVGSLPFWARLLSCIILGKFSIENLLSVIDFVFLGITMSWTSLNEISSYATHKRRNTKFTSQETYRKWLYILIFIFACIATGLFICDFLNIENDNPWLIYAVVFIFCIVAFMFSYSLEKTLKTL